jgi:hypothetical protein
MRFPRINVVPPLMPPISNKYIYKIRYKTAFSKHLHVNEYFSHLVLTHPHIGTYLGKLFWQNKVVKKQMQEKNKQLRAEL